MRCLEVFMVCSLALFESGRCFCISDKKALEQSTNFAGNLLRDEKRAALIYRRYLWPATYGSNNKVAKILIPYTVKTATGWFSSGLDNNDKQTIREAAHVIEQHTCVRFVERTTQADYIEFFSDENNYCESNIGKKGGKQTLYLGTGCRTRGHVTHELMHALGFFHEHTRPDRNKFVKILWDNIKKDQFDQFKIRTTYEATSFGQPYDFQSIMHYTNKEFSSNGEDTIQAIANPNMALGNINSMSAVDVLQVNLLYKCPEAQRKVVNYKVTVFTGNKFFAGTDARAFLELFGHTTGREKNSGEVELAGQPKSFEKGAVDTFNFISPVLGKLTKLTIRHNHAGFGAGWYLSKIRVKNSERQEDFLFVCNCWMEGTPNTRTLTPIESKYIPFL